MSFTADKPAASERSSVSGILFIDVFVKKGLLQETICQSVAMHKDLHTAAGFLFI